MICRLCPDITNRTNDISRTKHVAAQMVCYVTLLGYVTFPATTEFQKFKNFHSDSYTEDLQQNNVLD